MIHNCCRVSKIALHPAARPNHREAKTMTHHALCMIDDSILDDLTRDQFETAMSQLEWALVNSSSFYRTFCESIDDAEILREVEQHLLDASLAAGVAQPEATIALA